MNALRPSPTDIMATITAIEAGDLYIDPMVDRVFWSAQLYDPKGCLMADGQAETAATAMAMAWLTTGHPTRSSRTTSSSTPRWSFPTAGCFE